MRAIPFAVLEDISPFAVLEDISPFAVLEETNLRALPWQISPQLDDECAYWRATGSRLGGLDIGAADTGIEGDKFTTGQLSPQADGEAGVEIVETRTAATSITPNIPSGGAWHSDGPPTSAYLAGLGYLVAKLDAGQTPSQGGYTVNDTTHAFSFAAGITGDIVLHYRVAFPSAFVLRFGTEQGASDGQGILTAVDAHAWTVTGASFWTIGRDFRGLATVRNFGGPEWVVDAPDATALGLAPGDPLVLRLVATPPGQAAIPLFFLLSAPRESP